jgi:hypothetical protein
MSKYEDEIREVLRQCGVEIDEDEATEDSAVSMLHSILVRDLGVDAKEVDNLLGALQHDKRALLALSRVLQSLLKGLLQM